MLRPKPTAWNAVRTDALVDTSAATNGERGVLNAVRSAALAQQRQLRPPQLPEQPSKRGLGMIAAGDRICDPQFPTLGSINCPLERPQSLLQGRGPLLGAPAGQRPLAWMRTGVELF